MIWRLEDGPAATLVTFGKMNVDKRSRSFNNDTLNNVEVIDLTSEEEEPPRKRQKSATPVSDGSKSNTLPRAPSSLRPSHEQAAAKKGAKAVSTLQHTPWMSRPQPAWYTANTISSAPGHDATVNAKAGIVVDTIRQPEMHQRIDGAYRRNFEARMAKNDKLLDRLSISHDVKEPLPSRKALTPQHRSIAQKSNHRKIDPTNDSEQLLRLFKLGSSDPLKFNPNSTIPAVEPRTDNVPKTEHSQVIKKPAPKTHASSGSNLKSETRFSIGQENPATKFVRYRSNHENQTSQQSTRSLVVLPTVTPPTPITTTKKQAQPDPDSPAKVSVNVPVPKLKAERRTLQERLKQGIEYAKAQSEELETVLGLTGFSKRFAPDLDEERFRRAAQPKKRIVDRGKVSLDVSRAGGTPKTVMSITNYQMVHPKAQAKAILTARFAEHFKPPLNFSNTVDDRALNGKFQFISEYILRKGVKAVGQVETFGCECGQQCISHCACLQKHFKDSRSKREWFELVPQYEVRPDGLVVLRDDFIKRYTISGESLEDEDEDDDVSAAAQRVEITECNDACSCGASCINRVVQQGRTVPLEIFQTARCGFGVRSSQNLVRGQFIELYLGEVITEGELVRREEAAEAGSTSYIYSLDWFSPQQPYHVDGENFGSAMRFVNHSCDPNSGTFTVLNDRSTKQLHHVAFFALRDISAGTEITIDYTPQAAGTTYELKDADEGMERCYCGASNCRRMLWLPGKERKARKKIVGRSFE